MVRTAAAAGASSASVVLFAVWLILQPNIVGGMVYTVIPLVQLHLPSCSDVRNHDNCTIVVQRAIQVPKFQCIVANGTETIYLDGRNETHAYAYDNSSIVVAWNESFVCSIQEPYCRHSMDDCRQFPNGTTTPCHNGTVNPNLLRLRSTTTSICWISDFLYDFEVYGAAEVEWYDEHFCHPTVVQNQTELNLPEIAAVLKQPALPGDVALQYVCRKQAEDGTNNIDGFAVRYFDWKDGSLYGTATDDGEELPGWTCIAEEVWYNPFNFTWKKSGALNDDGTLSDCNVTKESETGDTTLTLNSGVMGTITATIAATMTALATFYTMLV
jgi:hypothetical protein